MSKTDVIVLGAGMVGISAALALQKRGRQVILLDRRGAAEETSYGNAGIIQREGTVPYPFPRDPWKLAKYAFNLLPEAHLQWSALPSIAPWLYKYWRASVPEKQAEIARAAHPLIERCITEHEAFMADAGVTGMLRRTGYMRVYRTSAALDDDLREDERARQTFGVDFKALDRAGVMALEPHLMGDIAGGVHLTQPASIGDPEKLGKAYADLFVKNGGRFLRGEARSLVRHSDGWQVMSAEGPVRAPDVVIALGPWSADVLRALGYKLPLGVKRGYHMHFTARGNATLNRPIIAAESGYALAPMTRGIRLTTGAEFALRDAPSSDRPLEKVEPLARSIFPLGERAEGKVWRGARPCFPDMLPVIGKAPNHAGLWLDFGHHHLGFTLGPVSARLLAELMTGAEPFTDPRPYRVERWG